MMTSVTNSTAKQGPLPTMMFLPLASIVLWLYMSISALRDVKVMSWANTIHRGAAWREG